jgi:tetratricopeptide (TPR) repeat protein
LGAPGGVTTVPAVVGERTQGRTVVVDGSAREWPFARATTPSFAPSSATLVVLERLDEAFPDGQDGGTRLVLTQATYQLQRWLDWLAAHPAVDVLADLSCAPPRLAQEARSRRGAWSRIEVVDVAPGVPGTRSPLSPLLAAFRQSSPVERHHVCEQVVESSARPEPAVLLALASACIEVGRLDDAFASLERACRTAPEWEAVHFELGKAWLRADATDRAADAFATAARLMPSFAAAHANLGTALGELERPEEALVALDVAVTLDPEGYPAHNSRGACLRDLGRLQEAEASFRRVIALRPGFPFGYYNLGQTLFLQGHFVQARQAYEEGVRSDAARTPWQLARLALACAALEDSAAAASYATEALATVQPERRPDLVAEIHEVLAALTALRGKEDAAIQAVAAVATAPPDVP